MWAEIRTASIKLETRGATTEIDEYMVSEAKRIINACAAMYDVDVKIVMAGAAPACFADKELGHEVAELIEEKCHYDEVLEYVDMGGSEAYNAFRVPHFLLLNLAVGGMLGGKVDRSALPAEYLVDYVRVYQKTE